MMNDDEPAEFQYCGLASCGPGAECPDCLRAQGIGCVHSEVHAPGTEPYAVGRDSEGEPSCEACLNNDQEGCAMDDTNVRQDKYTGIDNHGKPKSQYTEKLSAMDDAALAKAASDMIWLSAYASNNHRSDYHWKCDAVYDECVKRGKVTIYERAHADLMREAAR